MKPVDGEVSAVEVARETMIGDLVRMTIDELKSAPTVWQKMSEAKQQEAIDRITNRIVHNVTQAVFILASDARPTINAKLDQITTKAEMKCVLLVSKMHPDRHQLMDSCGQDVLIILPNVEEFAQQEAGVAPEPDQPGLVLANEDSEDPLLDQAIEFIRAEGKALISGLQRHLRIGYNRAARLLDRMESLGIVGPADFNGNRAIYQAGGFAE